MAKAFDVEYYIDFAEVRIKATCEFESAKMGLNYDVLYKEAIALARKRAHEYDDRLGTAGFIRWFNNICHTSASSLLMNKVEYQKLLLQVVGKKHDNLKPFEKAIPSTVSTYLRDIDNTTQGEVHTPVKVVDVDPRELEPMHCNQCNGDKQRKDFYNSKNTKSGKMQPCKTCIGENTKKRQQEAKNTSGIPDQKGKIAFQPYQQLPVSPYALDEQDIDILLTGLQDKLSVANTVVDSRMVELKKAEEERDKIFNLIEKIKRRKTTSNGNKDKQW